MPLPRLAATQLPIVPRDPRWYVLEDFWRTLSTYSWLQFTGKPNTELGDFSGCKSTHTSAPSSEVDDLPKTTTEACSKEQVSRLRAMLYNSSTHDFSNKPKAGSSAAAPSSSPIDGSQADTDEWVSITKEGLDRSHEETQKQDQSKKYGAVHPRVQADVCSGEASWTNSDWPKPCGER